GKSTLINTWLGEERLVAFDMPGTTRDAIAVDFERTGQKFKLIDTAGLRRKGRVFEAIEKFSVVKTLQAIADAHVVLLLLDATQGVTDQDAH
ncbi:GTPase, partial [Acinetobacter baumannii]